MSARRDYVMDNPQKRWLARNPDWVKQWRKKNAEKLKARGREWRAAHPEVARRWEEAHPRYRHNAHLKRRYGMSVDVYDRLFKEQRGRCGICGGPPLPKTRPFDVDHDHQTGDIRGLLCNPCNRSLGHIERFLAAPTNILRWLRRR